ncbi:AlwI family type II restriction endonuclease [Sphingobacterium cavernae]|uniref:AlwI family type II restriction endonuclease n=1 Tax=Sphingobacterium cavernae TaxID=2592657 RepID=UPI001662A90B|nr:AlwI family type II restriction endonuclease [Sphingobacterium cavernae]
MFRYLTFLSSIPQYFGFLYIDYTTTPNTIRVTKAGYCLFKESEQFVNDFDYPNLALAEKDKSSYDYSDIYLQQFIKLQITNPIILKDCEDIFIFPLYVVLSLIKKLDYLSYEELALYVFNTRSIDEIDLKIMEISNFRDLEYYKQIKFIDVFKKTHLGNISLVKAPTTSYFQKLCSYTDLLIKDEVVINSSTDKEYRKVNCIRLNKDKIETVNHILNNCKIDFYDFKEDLDLWIEYIGNPEIKTTPKDVELVNKSTDALLFTILKNGKFYAGDLLNANDVYIFPYLESNFYNIQILDKNSGKVHKSYKVEKYTNKINLFLDNDDVVKEDVFTLENLSTEIINHIEANNFCKNYSSYLYILTKFTGKDYLNNKSLRGARLEFLFYKLFNSLKEFKIIDEVIWGGKIGKYGLPSQAPGGPKGNPDLIVFVDNKLLVVELTTIKSKSQQWTAEAASVPDHIKNVYHDYNGKYDIIGLYLAPIQHDRVKSGIMSNLNDFNVKMLFKEIPQMVDVLTTVKHKKELLESIII